ncbi:MAG TPA: hypothetical protein VML50_19055 [Anaeromyxobacter sp.]|nr:hypothetical protein [Anaeromyxobacter sp.]
MGESIQKLAVHLGAQAVHVAEPPGREVQQLWFALARRRWTSLALIPADEGGSTAELASSLAEVGRQLREGAVTALQLSRLDYITASGIADAVAANGRGEGLAQNLQVVIAVPSVIEEPLGVAVVHAADLAVLCVDLRRSHLGSARRTVEIVGRERFAGSILLRRR